jgi:hypothetical protein
LIEFFTCVMGGLATISIFQPKIRSDLTFALIIIPMILFSGLRWEMGTDWNNYLHMFLYPDSDYTKSMEPGYQYYIHFLRYFTDDYTFYLLVTDALTLGGISYLIFRYSNRNFLSLFYSTGTLFWYAGSLRQMLSLLFITASLKFVFDRRFALFVICIALAFSLHKSSFFFAINYFIYSYSFASLLVLCAFIIIAIDRLIVLFDYFMSIFYDAVAIQFRINGEAFINSNPWLGIPRKLVLLFGMLYFYKKIPPEMIIGDEKVIRFYLKMIILSIFFYIIGTFFIEHVSSRMDIFTGFICAPILLGLLDNHLYKVKDRFYLLLFVVFLNLVFYSRLEFLDLFHPYSSVFYNRNFNRALY